MIIKIRKDLSILLSMLLILLFLPLFFHGSPYIMHILIVCLIWSTVASAWDLIMGYAGVFSFGQLAFFAFGAYTSGMMTIYLGISPWVGILSGGIAAALVGIIIGLPCLKLKGVYVALVTFALHLILEPFIRSNVGRALGTGGSTGLLGIPPLEIAGYTFSALEKVPWYFVALAMFSIAHFAIYKIIHSPIGLAFIALRDAEPLATSTGVNDYKYKLIVFSISAFITGIAGAFYVYYSSSVSPKILGLDIFLTVMIMLIVGGMGRFPGIAIGAFIITILSELLRPTGLFHVLIFAAMVVIFILFMPQGLMGIFDSLSRIVKSRLQKIRQKEAI